MYVAIGSDGTTSWRLSENRENGVCGHCFFKDDAVSHAHCARGPCMLFVCLVHARAWRCVRYVVLVVLLLIIVSFGTSFRLWVARYVFSLRFHGFRCSVF